MKKYIALILMLISCNNFKGESSSILKSKIDALPLKGIQTKYEVDSLGKIIDTISTVDWKENAEGNTVYENIVYVMNDDTMFTENYYHEHGELINQTSISSILNRVTEISFQLDKKGDIIDGVLISGRDLDEHIDTAYITSEIDYYLNGNKKRYKVSSKNEDIEIAHISNFNKDGKVVFEIEFNNSDTLNFVNYSYIGTELEKKEMHRFYEKEHKEIHNYNEIGKVKSIIEYQKNESEFWEKTDSTYIEYREDGYRLLEVKTNFENKITRYFKYEFEFAEKE